MISLPRVHLLIPKSGVEPHELAMGGGLAAAPVLSTPDTHILTEAEPVEGFKNSLALSEEQLWIRYEISRTIEEINRHRWRRIALQFPDQMLPHSSRVYEAISRGLLQTARISRQGHRGPNEPLEAQGETSGANEGEQPVKLTILADTSYGSCCVDEIAAEHVDAESVIHYGRACLSPSARLPVLHIYTEQDLDHEQCIEAFKSTFPDHAAKVILTGDIPYHSHIENIGQALWKAGYEHIFAAQIVHDPASLVPNRTLPEEVNNASQLGEWHLFHVAEPPTSLLLTLSSRMKSVRIYDPSVTDRDCHDQPTAHEANTAMLLRRRYALVTSMTTVSTWGILINTLSVKNYLSMVNHVKEQIAAAGKKSYLFVVGKLNAAKVANFAEIGGWVVIGCWESSLIDSRDFYKPIITPFELDMALASDNSRVWTGAWRSDFDEVLSQANQGSPEETLEEAVGDHQDTQDFDSDEESAPPEFDLRTGRYVAQTRPMGVRTKPTLGNEDGTVSRSSALIKRANGDILVVNGLVSPAANHLHERRTWKGLGSDFEVKYDDEEQEGGLLEQGRTGTARGYDVGDALQT